MGLMILERDSQDEFPRPGDPPGKSFIDPVPQRYGEPPLRTIVDHVLPEKSTPERRGDRYEPPQRPPDGPIPARH